MCVDRVNFFFKQPEQPRKSPLNASSCHTNSPPQIDFFPLSLALSDPFDGGTFLLHCFLSDYEKKRKLYSLLFPPPFPSSSCTLRLRE